MSDHQAPAERLDALVELNADIETRRRELGNEIRRRSRMLNKMVDDGIGREEIARVCGVPSSTVYGWMGRTTRNGRWR